MYVVTTQFGVHLIKVDKLITIVLNQSISFGLYRNYHSREEETQDAIPQIKLWLFRNFNIEGITPGIQWANI